MNFILGALLSAICLGSAYVFLGFMNDLSPFVIQLIYAAYMATTSLASIGVVYKDKYADAFKPITGRLFGFATGYSLLSVVGTIIYLYDAQLPGVSISVLTAISSCYNVVTTGGNILFLPNELQRLNLWYEIPGTLL